METTSLTEDLMVYFVQHPENGPGHRGHSRNVIHSSQNMDHILSAKDLKNIMHVMYPDVEGDGDDKCDFEHPMTAVGIVLLIAALK